MVTARQCLAALLLACCYAFAGAQPADLPCIAAPGGDGTPSVSVRVDRLGRSDYWYCPKLGQFAPFVVVIAQREGYALKLPQTSAGKTVAQLVSEAWRLNASLGCEAPELAELCAAGYKAALADPTYAALMPRWVVDKNGTAPDRPMWTGADGNKAAKPRATVGLECDCSQPAWRYEIGKQMRCPLKVDAALTISATDPPLQFVTACVRKP